MYFLLGRTYLFLFFFFLTDFSNFWNFVYFLYLYAMLMPIVSRDSRSFLHMAAIFVQIKNKYEFSFVLYMKNCSFSMKLP